MLHRDTFVGRDRAALECIEARGSVEQPSAEYPFILMTGRSLYQFNAGTMTGRTSNNDLRPTDVLEISPADANEANLTDGDLVRVTSRHGSTVLPVQMSAGMRRGQLYATFQRPDLAVNAVTGPHRDATVGTPAYKVTGVSITRT